MVVLFIVYNDLEFIGDPAFIFADDVRDPGSQHIRLEIVSADSFMFVADAVDVGQGDNIRIV